MKRKLLFTALSAGIYAIVMTLPGCAEDASVCSLSEEERTPVATFDVIAPAFPITAPFKLSGSIGGDVAIEWITVGGVLLEKANDNFQRWQLELSKNQLEAIREGNYARVDVYARTVCTAVPIRINKESLMVPLGPAENVPLTSLKLGDIVLPNNACYLPKNGSQWAKVQVSADVGAVGASVAIVATNGTVSPSGSVKLAKGDGMAFYDLTFTGTTAGFGGVYASSQGFSADPKFVRIADAPVISGANGTAKRGTPYPMYVHSRGQLARCKAETSPVNAATVTIVEPSLGIISGDMPVQGTKKTCEDDDTLKVHVEFAQNAPSNAQVRFSCTDTWEQPGSTATLTVGDEPIVPLVGLHLERTIPGNECYLPANGNAVATLHALADVQSVGAPISVATTHGDVMPSGQVKLVAVGNTAAYDFTFTAKTPGWVIPTAAGQGTAKLGEKILVAGSPTILPSSGTAKRGIPYSLYVRSDGNLSNCQFEATNPGAVTALVADPPLGPIDGVKVVKETVLNCDVAELLRVDVLFSAAAPDGTQASLRCVDTWGQLGQSTVTVATGP